MNLRRLKQIRYLHKPIHFGDEDIASAIAPQVRDAFRTLVPKPKDTVRKRNARKLRARVLQAITDRYLSSVRSTGYVPKEFVLYPRDVAPIEVTFAVHRSPYREHDEGNRSTVTSI
jgi:hypothetical protein